MRIPLHEIFLRTALLFKQRGTCNRKLVGGVLVKDGRIIATGYNGSPSGQPHCLEEGCITQNRDGRDSCIRTLHCEKAIISYCAQNGISTQGADLYITLTPCYDCAKDIINAGIKKVYYLEDYSGSDGKELLASAKIECIIYQLDAQHNEIFNT